jgi:hypothetical protein
MPHHAHHTTPPSAPTVRTDPAWAGWSRAYTRALPRLTGRTDLTATVTPGGLHPVWLTPDL